MKTLPLSVVLASFLGASCALTPLSVTLRPKVEVAATSLGQGRTVGVTVLDERPRSIVGYRGVGPYGPTGATITTAGDPSSAVRETLVDGLKRHGFNPVTGQIPEGRELRAEIRGLDYTRSQAIFASTLRAEFTLKGICVIGSARPHEGTYRGQHEESIHIDQDDSGIEEYLNLVSSLAIQRLFQDTQLIQCLAGTTSR
jgi:hypothetical protein